MRRRFRWISAAVVVLLAAAFAVGALVNSRRLDAVTVTFVGPGEETRDHVVLGVGGKDALPDYRLEIAYREGRLKRLKCGTHLNQSAKDGLQYAVAEGIPVRHVQELVLVEEDRLEDDVVARTQLLGDRPRANGYEFELAISRSFKVGLDWFFATPVGKAILAGIAIAVAVLIAGRFGLG